MVQLENDRDVRVAVEAERGFLVGERGLGLELVEHIAPVGGRVHGRMHECDAHREGDVVETAQPFAVFRRKRGARPCDHGRRERGEVIQRLLRAAVAVVVSANGHGAEVAHDFAAFVRARVVSDDVPDAQVVRDALFPGVGQNHLQRVEIGVDVSEKRYFSSTHSCRYLAAAA